VDNLQLGRKQLDWGNNGEIFFMPLGNFKTEMVKVNAV
jgi:hypothetical protein